MAIVRAKLTNVLWINIIGLGIGWMVGLAISPVVSIVLTSVMGTVAAIIAAASGLATTDATEPQGAPAQASRWIVNPLPTAILIIGIFIGSLFGIRARNANWLGQTPQAEITRWRNAGLEISDSEIVARLFAQEYPDAAPAPLAAASVPAASDRGGTVLFGVEADECAGLLGISGELLREALRLSANEQLHQLPEIINNDEELKQLIEEVLCAVG